MHLRWVYKQTIPLPALIPCWFVLVIFVGNPFLLPLSCRHSNRMNYFEQLMGRCFQQCLRLCLPKHHSLCHEFRSARQPSIGWVLSLTRNLGSMGTKTGADVVMRKLKGTDFFPTLGTLQVRTGSAALRQWPKAMAQFLCAQCRQRGRLCPEGWAAAHTTLSFCSFSADIMQLQLLSTETERLPMVTHVQVTARKRKHML